MSKTIDVMEGDRFERTQTTVYQYRDGKCRGISDRKVDEWWPDADTDDEFEITRKSAEQSFQRWGYTLTPAAKPEANGNCQQESKPETLTQAKPADAPAVKENLTTDVPVVDAVWVEKTVVEKDGSLWAFPNERSAMTCYGQEIRNGTARIVRIRSVDELARELARNADSRIGQWIGQLNTLGNRVFALESRLAALEKPADKPAARVVKLPEMLKRIDDAQWVTGWYSCMREVKKALASQGIKVEAAE